MPLRSAVSTLAAAEEFFAGKTAPDLTRSPGIKEPAVAELKAPTPKGTRKPRTVKGASKAVVVSGAVPDVKAVRALLASVELDMLDVKGKMNKALEKFQPRLGRLRARHAELSEELAKVLTR